MSPWLSAVPSNPLRGDLYLSSKQTYVWTSLSSVGLVQRTISWSSRLPIRLTCTLAGGSVVTAGTRANIREFVYSSLTVVSRFLVGAVQAVKLDAQDVGGHNAVGTAGQTSPVESPVQRSGVKAQLSSESAGGRQTRANSHDGILRGDHGNIWTMEAHQASF
ncbi:hypothetical protein XENOCAPTIV_008265 [Xenoophorus captivus]|uniref:Uncharacterized protein n=1 Tax=Xenoophorus captivus TaxID=1517983 RepID=A0ABV0RG90_9TELE